MRKNLAVLSIVVRSSIYKILLVLVGMSLVQVGLSYSYLSKSDLIVWNLEVLVESIYMKEVFLVTLVLIGIILLWAMGEKFGTKQAYYYDRISVKRSGRFWLWTGYTVFCFSLLFMVQIGLVFVIGLLYERCSLEGYLYPQMYFLTFYQNEFLHNLFPMTDIVKWITNILFVLAMSVDIVKANCYSRKPYGVVWFFLLYLEALSSEMGHYGWDIVLILAAVIYLGMNYETDFFS